MTSDSRNASPASEPFPAASLILIQDSSEGDLKVLLLKRNKSQAFGANAFVFPGGKLDDQDQDPALAAVSGGLDGETAREKLNEPDLSPRIALGLFFTALRETFEESGVWIHSQEGCAPPAGTRRKMNSGEITLKDLASTGDVAFNLDLLTPYARWITPSIEKRRFDARFFLGLLPYGLKPVHDNKEMTETLWTTPAEALKLNDAGEIHLMPPTMKILEGLAGFKTSDEAFKAAGSKEILPILPEPVRTEKSIYLKLPHDPEYSLEGYKQPPRPEEPSRILLTSTGWKTRTIGQIAAEV